MNKTRLQKGITLIALIITIVVLLIIAVVTIGVVQESGIIRHAQDAESEYTAKKGEEESIISGYESLIESNLPGGNGGDVVTPPPSGGDGTPPETYLTQDNAELEKLATGVSLVEYKDLKAGSRLKTLADSGKVIAVLTDGTYKAVIPSGFSILTTSATGETIANGLVVVDGQGNEFVWVPVTDDISATSSYDEPSVVGAVGTDNYGNPTYTYDAVEANLERANCEDIDGDGTLEISDFETELKNIYAEMAESVNECDGFYVGRYEVSFNESRKAQSKGSLVEPYVYSAINSTTSTNNNNATDWYGLYALCKTYNTSSVKSSMICGIQYDKMISWMGSDATNFNTLNRNTDEQRRTGYISTDIIRNVYDLGGNSVEWTLEADYADHRFGRGGGYIDSLSPRVRSSIYPTLPSDFLGSRLTLYIK